jgi:enoyl-[acyl-carrier protein] reductase I
VCFLLSDYARGVSGEILHVDGGFHAMGPVPAQVAEEAAS